MPRLLDGRVSRWLLRRDHVLLVKELIRNKILCLGTLLLRYRLNDVSSGRTG